MTRSDPKIAPPPSQHDPDHSMKHNYKDLERLTWMVFTNIHYGWKRLRCWRETLGSFFLGFPNEAR